MATEEPAYEVVREDQASSCAAISRNCSLKPRCRAASTRWAARPFGILADYIFGNNQAAEKIAMTAPVTQRPSANDDDQAGTRIEMTAPVTQRPAQTDGDSFIISFVMPERFTLETVPRPNDPRVSLREAPWPSDGRAALLRRLGRIQLPEP